MTSTTRKICVPLSRGTADVTLTVAGEVTGRSRFSQALDEAVGLLVSVVTWSLSSLGAKSGTRGEEHLNTTTVRFELDFGHNSYGFVIAVCTDMQGVTQADVAKLLAHVPCSATTIVEYIDVRTKPQPEPKLDLTGMLGSFGLGGFFGSTPRGGTENPVGIDVNSLLFRGRGSVFGGESYSG